MATPGSNSTGEGGETGKAAGFIPLVTVVDFHHHRGPEVERWFGVAEGQDPAADYDWTLLPFMALSDGAHASTEDFSYFTLLRPATDDSPATSLFGISCTRQLDASQLLVRPADVTRSTVQKAVVVIADSPQFFGMLRERLSIVTNAWFAQREFSDTEILRRFQESLADEKTRGQMNEDVDRDQYLGMSLRELVREFRWQTLVLLKCCLLQPKMLFFGSRCERLCMMQFSLISLIPGLLRSLQDCAGPDLNNYEKNLSRPTSLRSSDRNSLLSYMGLPLQIFGKGSLFGPYTPLQQLDVLADFGTKSYIVGSTNSLLLQQRDRYSDILINLDENTINITSTSLRTALALSHSDRRWIDVITQEVNDTWDEANPGRPKTMGYRGSEEFIRLQFEEYLLSLISSVKYHNYLTQNAHNPKALLPHIEGDPSVDFSNEWVEYWMRTENYRMWSSHTDSHLFDIVEPKHPCAGGLTVDDVQRRIQQQVQDLHLDERFAVGKEVLGRNLAAGRDKASTMFNRFYADMETLREAQRKRAEETQAAEKNGSATNDADSGKTQQAGGSVSSRAGAYIGSWTSWADQKRKQGWGRSSGSASSGGWGFGSKRLSRGFNMDSGSEKNATPLSSPALSSPGFTSTEKIQMSDVQHRSSEGTDRRPLTQDSFGESLLDTAGSTESGASSPASVRKPTPAPERGDTINGSKLEEVKEQSEVAEAAVEKKGEEKKSEEKSEEESKEKIEEPKAAVETTA
ncbi:transport protein Avl9-domain-containing protein [Annulohypoxylon maeteangense]|uniref:transport protein Avl9-domain-containing protein n=1 Tax=Annulohypoxylon maeteangense TaxID=1927788 RepID=UPI002008B7A7|nr:transport protein Avl9-domain-containing protein [Annulohypoxylon maeteangense]KAI0890222.1 transport protein Avl9-domain-containing protein [Annulohypoxylon maeteangense]